MPEEFKTARKVVGVRQLSKAIRRGEVLTVFLAKDADPAVTEPVQALAEAAGVQIRWVDSMRALGAACGISVGASAAGTLK